MTMGEDFLEKVAARKKADIEQAQNSRPEASLRREAEQTPKKRGFISSLTTGEPDAVHIIAEIKRASPSRGEIRAGLDPAELARAYAAGGASALSVLTEPHWFQGSVSDLQAARAATALPVLRKDFVISAYQVYESAVIGADAVLLIAAILSAGELADLLALCRDLGLDALVEIHSQQDLETVRSSNARLVGINNRNLRSLETDIGTAAAMAGGLGPDQVPVAASGIRRREDIEKMLGHGIRRFLIGEHLVRSDAPEKLLRELILC